MRGDTRIHKQNEVDDEDESQEHVCGDFDLPECIDGGVALIGECVENLVAWDEAFKFEKDRLPVQEPAIAQRVDHGGEGETPDEEVDSYVPAWVDRFALAVEDVKPDGERVIEESEADL